MKLKLIIAVAAVLTALFLLTVPANGKDYGEPVSQVTVYEERSLSPEQVIWLARLMNCESGIKSGAINPKDLDNTPSYGILQFKPGTFNHFAAKYGIEGHYMEAPLQVKIVMRWVQNPGEVIWQNQFPACVKLLGEPPVPYEQTLPQLETPQD